MWGVFAGIAIWCALYPWITEWLERRASQKCSPRCNCIPSENINGMRCVGDGWNSRLSEAIRRPVEIGLKAKK